MKDIRLAVRGILVDDPAVAALVGTRVFPARLPQGELRASVVYIRVSGVGDYHMAGPSGLAQTRMQIDAWGGTADEATAVANACYDALTGFRGIKNDVTVQGAFMLVEREAFDTAVQRFSVTRDFYFWYEE